MSNAAIWIGLRAVVFGVAVTVLGTSQSFSGTKDHALAPLFEPANGVETPEFIMLFTAAAALPSGTSPPPSQAVPDRARLSEVEPGTRLTTDMLVSMLQSSEMSASAPEQQALFQDTALNVWFEDRQAGQVEQIDLGHCETINFETVDETPFGRMATCGDHLFSFNAGRDGLEILRDGEIYMQMALDAGNYMLNGVPFLVIQ